MHKNIAIVLPITVNLKKPQTKVEKDGTIRIGIIPCIVSGNLIFLFIQLTTNSIKNVAITPPRNPDLISAHTKSAIKTGIILGQSEIEYDLVT